MKIEDIKKGLSIVGLEPSVVATVKSVEAIGPDSVQVFFQCPDGSFNERLVGRADAQRVLIIAPGSLVVRRRATLGNLVDQLCVE